MELSATEDANVTIETPRDVLQSTPFRPFRHHIADGRDISARHRECVAYDPERPRTVLVIDPDERTHFLDMRLIAEVEVDPRSLACSYSY